jgi:hypothetical protein
VLRRWAGLMRDAEDQSLVQLAAKNRRLAGNSKLGDDGGATSLGNPYSRVPAPGAPSNHG